jgi:hypothetical protein
MTNRFVEMNDEFQALSVAASYGHQTVVRSRPLP